MHYIGLRMAQSPFLLRHWERPSRLRLATTFLEDKQTAAAAKPTTLVEYGRTTEDSGTTADLDVGRSGSNLEVGRSVVQRSAPTPSPEVADERDSVEQLSADDIV